MRRKTPFLFNEHHFDAFHGVDFAPHAFAGFRKPADRAEVDILASTRTSAVLSVGGVLTSSIGRVADADWAKVSLTGGVTYVFEQKGADTASGSLADPLIKGIYNAKGRLISGTSDDDSGAGSNAKVIFTPTTDGVYFVSASAYGSSTGTYALSVSTLVDTTAPTLSSVTPADNATNVSVGANIVVTFSEEIQRGSGNIVLTTSSGVTTISMSDVAQVQISGDQMVINPASDLAAGQAYDVQIASGAVRDLAGNAFGGTAFDFTTASASSGGGVTWNIMVYVAGDNDLEGFGVGDVNEMESVRLPDGVKMSVLFDRSPSYDASNGNWTGTRQGLITFDGTNSTLTSLPTAAAITEVNTGLASSLTSFINWADGAVNADHNMLVIWNHGGGLDGVAWDYSSRYDYLTFNEIKSAIGASTVSKFDVIGFDACLMAMSELVYDLSSLTDYVVASQELEPGDGWDYAEFIRRLQADASLDGQDVALAAVNAYPAQYAGASDITLSAVSTSAFSSVASELNDFVAAALALPSSNADWSVMRAAADAAREYPYRDTSYGFADLGEFMAIVANRAGSAALKAEAAQVAAAVDAAVIAEVGSVSAATGLSIYLPPTGISSLGGWYSETSFNFLAGVAWDDFLYRL